MTDPIELRRLLEEASPRPWIAADGGEWHASVISTGERIHSDVADTGNRAEADLIAAAVNALPDLLDDLAKAEGHRDNLATALLEVQREKRHLVEALERVKALHYTHECIPLDSHCFIVFGGGCAAVGTCATCRGSYPCPTLLAIDGEPSEKEEGKNEASP